MRFGVIYFTRIKKNDSLGFCFVFLNWENFPLLIEYFARKNIIIGLHKTYMNLRIYE